MNMLKTVMMLGTMVLMSGAAFAHHSFAMFDKDKEVTLSGTVKEFQWTNPHAWLQLKVADDSGKLVEWSIEMGSVNILSRQGWKKSSFKPGEKVTVVINPMRDGTSAGSLVRATSESGEPIPARDSQTAAR
jgi:hypothetical protein